jgi:hypothetical protein
MVESIASYLPSVLTALIGREGEISEAAALLQRPDVRIVTLSGPGGTGKTRLALEVAQQVAPDYDPVAFVALANVFDPAAVLPSIAQVVGIREDGERSIAERLYDAFRERRLLLVLDNFEQVTDAVKSVASLLGVCPGVKALVTSQLVLHIRGERELPLAPLPVPDASAPRDDLLKNPAVALFVERAQAVKPDLELSPACTVHRDRGYAGATTRTVLAECGLTGVVARRGVPAPSGRAHPGVDERLWQPAALHRAPRSGRQLLGLPRRRLRRRAPAHPDGPEALSMGRSPNRTAAHVMPIAGRS